MEESALTLCAYIGINNGGSMHEKMYRAMPKGGNDACRRVENIN